LGYKADYKYAGSFQRSAIYSARRIPILKIGNPCMYTFYIVTNIKHYTGEYVEYERETYRQERRVDEEKPDFIDRYIKALT
jgi:hypothetical protein